MRTTIDIPDDLLAQARESCGMKSTKDVVCWALETAIRQKAVAGLMAMRGKVEFTMTPEEIEDREIRADRRRRKLAGPPV
jgi:Arc/MetJ family transcription regulator